jgi:hypothetical protein
VKEETAFMAARHGGTPLQRQCRSAASGGAAGRWSRRYDTKSGYLDIVSESRHIVSTT